jgi:hypothetical protein
MKYQVIVGNVGTVIDTNNKKEADKTYKQYMHDSDDNIGRVGGEIVTLMEDDEIVREFNPLNKE